MVIHDYYMVLKYIKGCAGEKIGWNQVADHPEQIYEVTFVNGDNS